MRILIANDDGYLAPGLTALVRACEGLGELDVVAPEQNASGTSNSLTLNRPLSVYTAANGYRYINGTPSDCVHVALTGLVRQRPDLVVSGINQGANMGDDTLYSGTVAAAMEGYLFGIPAIAFSQVDKGWGHLDAAARAARRIVQRVLAGLAQRQEAGVDAVGFAADGAGAMPAVAVDDCVVGGGTGAAAFLLNVNIPNRADADTLTLEVTRLGRRHASEPVIRQTSPRGDTLYWIGAAGDARVAGAGTDFHATASGRISLTPLQVDLTDHGALTAWHAWTARTAGARAPG